VAPAATRCAGCSDWGWLQGFSPIGKWNGQLIHLPHTKIQELMAYSRPCCKRDGRLLSLTWSGFFVPACPTGYVPAKWHQVKVVFIPKCGRNSYSGPSDFRPISLKSFLLKTMARLVDGYLQDEVLALVTLHPNQHGYQAGKSVKMVLHQF